MWKTIPGAALAVAFLALPAQAQEATAAADDVIAQYEGSGLATLRPFTTEGPWEVTWTTEGSLFQMWTDIEHPGVGPMTTMLANQSPAGEGSSYQAKPGKYALTVNAIGDWKVVVRAVE